MFSYGGKRDLLSRVYASDKDRQYALEKAKELQSGLASETPSFVKPMLQSHVTGGFWLVSPNLVLFICFYPSFEAYLTVAKLVVVKI